MDRPDDLAFMSNFPMPPPASALTRNVAKYGRAKTARYKGYERAVMAWMLTNRQELDIARQVTLKCGPNRFLHVDSVFKFHRKNVLTKENKPQKMDTSNRIKALHDVMAKILGLDDCYFFSGSFDKQVIGDDQPEHVQITIIVDSL